MTYPNVERKHVLLGAGAFEERTYVDGVLVDVRVYFLGHARATQHRAPWRAAA